MLTPEQVKCMIFEVYRGNLDSSSINESQVGVPPGMMRVTGVAAQLGVKNRNGRIYTEDNYLKHIDLLQPEIEAGLYGTLEHPDNFTIDLNNVSHKIEKLWYNPDTKEVMITILLLDTEKGKIAQSIIKSGGKVHVSSRAMGSVKKNSEAVIDKLVTYDIVGTPGFKESDLVLDENLKVLGKTSLCESWYMPINEDKTPANSPTGNSNHFSNHTNMPTNVSMLEAELARRNANRMNEQYITRQQLIENVCPTISRFVTEQASADIALWLAESLFPLYEEYTKKKAINESMGKNACSFGAYYKMVRSETARLNEGQQLPNGQVVLTQEEQKCLQKLAQGQQLTQRQQQIVQQAQQKLNQNLQQQQNPAQVNEVDQNPQNGEVVLTQDEQQAVQKLQEGQQLDQEEQKLAQQAIQKLQQQQQKQQQGSSQQQKSEQELRESLNEKNNNLSAAYKRLMEAEDPQEMEKISQECDQLKQEIQDVEVALDAIAEGQQQKPSQRVQQAQQKIAQGQSLTQEEIDALSEDELQQIIQQAQQQQPQNEGAGDNYDDPNDAKVFENQDQCIKQVQQICQQLQQSGQLTQQQQKVVDKLQQGEQLTQQEMDVCQELMQQQGIDQDGQEAVKQQQQLAQQQLPENDEQVNESLVGHAAADTLRRSGSLLESLQKRMTLNLGSKN